MAHDGRRIGDDINAAVAAGAIGWLGLKGDRATIAVPNVNGQPESPIRSVFIHL